MILITLGCFNNSVVVYAESFETENCVQVEIAPFLYKSTLYQIFVIFPN